MYIVKTCSPNLYLYSDTTPKRKSKLQQFSSVQFRPKIAPVGADGICRGASGTKWCITGVEETYTLHHHLTTGTQRDGKLVAYQPLDQANQPEPEDRL